MSLGTERVGKTIPYFGDVQRSGVQACRLSVIGAESERQAHSHLAFTGSGSTTIFHALAPAVRTLILKTVMSRRNELPGAPTTLLGSTALHLAAVDARPHSDPVLDSGTS